MPIRRFALTAATLGLLAVLLLPARLSLRTARADSKPPAASTVQLHALFQEKCSACHNLPDPQADGRTRAQWQRIVTQMLTRYHASDEITSPEAAQIVDYLATFAPEARPPRPGAAPGSAWGTDPLDVWSTAPALSRVFNFEAGPALPGLSPAGSGVPGPAAAWHSISGAGPDSAYVKVVPVKPDPSRFALLVDRADTARDLDMRVRFQIVAGRVSPAVGIAYGLADAADYSVLRFDARRGTLSVLKVSAAVHTVLQSTPLAASDTPAFKAPGWHTLRLLINGGRVHGWIDGTKRISTTDPAYAGGKVALWAQGDTVAAFDDWTADFYSSQPADPPRA